MGGLWVMFFCMIVIGGLGWSTSTKAQLAIGILLVVETLENMITVNPLNCNPGLTSAKILAWLDPLAIPLLRRPPSGRSRYKTIVIGRSVRNLTGIFNNSVTPRMLSPTGDNISSKVDLQFIAAANEEPSMELGGQECPLLCRYEPPVQHLVLVQITGDQR